jgi:hypothetical protein
MGKYFIGHALLGIYLGKRTIGIRHTATNCNEEEIREGYEDI